MAERSFPLDLVARLEFREPDNVSIHLKLPEDSASACDDGDRDGPPQLSPREQAIVALIGQGKETDEIASTLFITPATVRTHVRNAMSKVQAHTRAQLVAIVLGSRDADRSAAAEASGPPGA